MVHDTARRVHVAAHALLHLGAETLITLSLLAALILLAALVVAAEA